MTSRKNASKADELTLNARELRLKARGFESKAKVFEQKLRESSLNRKVFGLNAWEFS